MTEIDRIKFGPPDDTAILPWYRGVYSHGFAALHPFFTVKGLDPRSCEHGTLILERSGAREGVGLLEWADEEAANRRVGREITAAGVEALAKRVGQRISWRSVCEQADFANHCELDRALRTSISGLRDDLADKAGSDRLASYCSGGQVFPPTEGRLQPIMQTGLAELFRRAGFPEVIAGDEFGDEDRKIKVSMLEQSAPWDGADGLLGCSIKRLMAPDRSLLAWVHWDSFYTMILGTSQTLRDLKIDRLFEGFWCSDETTTYWLTQPCIPLVQ